MANERDATARAAIRRTLVQHAIALDLVVVATGAAFLARESAVAVIAAFLLATALSAWFGREELGLVATGYSVIILGLFFGDVVDVVALTGFAAGGAVISAFIRAFRRVSVAIPREEIAPAVVAVTAPQLRAAALPFAFGLPLLVIAVYTDVSDTIMRAYHVPSLLQPIIALTTIAVWNYRKSFRPGHAVFHIIPFLVGAYALVIFATSIWADDLSRADARLSELLKALFICVLVASLAASWEALRRGMTAMVAAAALMAGISTIQLLTGKLTHVLGGLVEPQTGTIYGEVQMPRASGPPVHDPNFYARILLLAIPLALTLGMAEKRPMRRAAYFAAAAVVAAGTLVTYSRGAMLSLLFVALLMLITARVKVRNMALGAVGLVLLLSLLPSELMEKRFETLKSVIPGSGVTKQDNSIEVRKLFGRAAMRMFENHPILGVGAGNYTPHYFDYSNLVGSPVYNYDPPGTDKFPHNFFLEVASETGLLGLLTFGAMMYAAFASLSLARRTLRARGEQQHAILAAGVAVALAGYLAASVFLHDTHQRYVGLTLGFAVGITRLTREAAVEEVRVPTVA